MHLFADFKPPSLHGKRIPVRGVVGIVAGAILIILIVGLWVRKRYIGGKISADKGKPFLVEKCTCLHNRYFLVQNLKKD